MTKQRELIINKTQVNEMTN